MPCDGIYTMSLRRILSLLAVAMTAAATVMDSKIAAKPGCRAILGDANWPSLDEWAALNNTLGGKLIATIPIATPCHQTLNGRPNILFDEDECEALRNVWFFPETHLASPNSPMAYPFSNNSCNPFLAPNTPCTNGYLAAYTINATDASDLQTGISFAARRNIRLTIRNTGHDYLGKSTGAYSLTVWTHHMKSLELIRNYWTAGYVGPAIKMGAGVEGIEAYNYAHGNGLVVVGANCPTVGLAGGFTQGGGHGPLVSRFGLGADQALEFDVVIGTGELLVANAQSNPDLFWALRGGGGSTYGIVVSMTVKAHPDEFVSLAYLTVLNNGTNADAIYTAMSTFFQALPRVVDAGVWLTWIAAPSGFLISPAFAPGLHPADLDSLLHSTLAKLD